MRILLAEDDFVTRKFMTSFLSKYGECDVTVDGMEAVDAFMMALEDDEPYDLVCLDIMMPVMDGYQALMGIRNLERERNVPKEKTAKVIMTTALNDEKNVKMAFDLGCTIYSGKPINQERFEQALKKLGLV
ncbi:MAG: response regulator [Lachnospiraceae bacterium]|nr:response regulator [Lachnospiraceae bacterium]